MTDITIPDEVVEAAARASYDEHRRDYNSTALECNYVPWEDEWSELLLSERMQWMAEARAAISAALKAWPKNDYITAKDWVGHKVDNVIILPLTQENIND